MTYRIDYAYACHKGNVRINNEDNFWCCGDTMDAQNEGIPGVRSGSAAHTEFPLLAVFDGMGGENCGEIAAYLAADACGDFYCSGKSTIKTEPEYFFDELCRDMNEVVCSYSRENKIGCMGTTAAILVFGPQAAYACNLGDSRIYQSRGHQFTQISTDHSRRSGLFGKAPLTQYVGVPEETMALEPSICELPYLSGDRYLLCSDGMTDMLSDGEIADILSRDIPVRETVEVLLDRALKKGGKDNVTIVLCEIAEYEAKSVFRRVLERLGAML